MATAAEESLPVYTIYDHPEDYPQYFVVRRFLVKAGQVVADESLLADTLDQARELVPLGAVCLGRSPGDDPNIVESWL